MAGIDFEALRRDLSDYYGTAASSFPAAFVNVSDVEKADERELEKMANEAGLDPREYRK